MNRAINSWLLPVPLFLSAICLIAGLDFIYAKYVFPLTEGWWELLAYSSEGAKLYKDVYIGLPPLYINFISLLLKISSNIYIERIIYISVHLLEFITLVFLIKKFNSINIAIISALFLELLLFAYNVAYLSKDYHVFLQLIINIYIILFISSISNRYSSKLIISLGVIAGLLVLTKQNVALVVICSSILYLVLQKRLSGVLIYIISIVSILLSYSLVNGHEWINTYIQNDSKGSFLTVLTRFFYYKSSVYAISYISLVVLSNYLDIRSDIKAHLKKLEIFIIIAMLISIAFNKNFDLIIGILLAELIINVLFELKIISFKGFLIQSAPISFLMLSLGYANSLTASLNLVGCQIIIAIFIASAIGKLYKINKHYFRIFSILLLIVIIINIVKKFDDKTYSWWGYTVGKLSESNIKATPLNLKGIYINYDTSYIFNVVEKLKSEKPDKKIYIYPQIPVLYYLFDIGVLTKFPIIWFDVIPTSLRSAILAEFDSISPDYIIWMRPQKFVYDGHYNLKKSDSVVSSLDLKILKLIEDGKYRIRNIHPMGLTGSRSLEVVNILDITMICEACTEGMLKKEMINGNILKYSRMSADNKSDILNITFQNSLSYTNFLHSLKPIVVNSDYPLFMILEKNKL